MDRTHAGRGKPAPRGLSNTDLSQASGAAGGGSPGLRGYLATPAGEGPFPAVLMVHESPMHLLMVPIYRLIYEPLRAYVVFGSAILALRGTAVGWYRPERTNSVLMPTGQAKLSSLAPAPAPADSLAPL